MPNATCEGVELNRDAVDLARQRGIFVHQGAPADLAAEQYDVVYSIAVLEHVPSPTKFLRELRRLLKPGGHLFLYQPTQDVPSYDLFSSTNQQFTRSYSKQQIDYVRALGDQCVLVQQPRTQQLLGWYTRVVTSLDEFCRPEKERLYRGGKNNGTTLWATTLQPNRLEKHQ
jgi:SAM-dependent methyltransferase